jgi:hypothetical protein
VADVVENLNALHKEVFADGVPDLVPNGAKLQQKVLFDKKAEMGLKYVQPVRLAYPGGFTHALGDGTEGAFSLNDAKSGTVKRAEVTAAQILLKDQMDYETAAKASRGDKKSFKEGTKFFYEGMQKALRKRIETQLWHGAQGLGVIETYTSGDPSIVISAATWASGIWAGLEGTEIDVQQVNTSTVRGSVTISSVDVENRKLTLSGTVTGCAAGDYVYFKGCYGKEMTGAMGILANATSLFGISAATYSLWKSPSYAVGSAAFSFGAIKKGISKAVAKGLDEDIVLFVNPGAWDDLLSDVAALRRTDKSEIKKLQIGAESIEFYSQNGKVEIVPTIFMKQGNAAALCVDYWKRLGASDVTFGTPGFGGEMFHHLETKAGIEARAYSHQAIFSEAPAKNILWTGIVNST